MARFRMLRRLSCHRKWGRGPMAERQPRGDAERDRKGGEMEKSIVCGVDGSIRRPHWLLRRD
jgi:hypothetical protein